MKKTLLLLLIVLLAACSAQTTEKPDENEHAEKQMNEDQKQTEEDVENEEDPETDEDSNSEEDTENGNDEKENEPDPIQYTVHPANWTLKPQSETELKTVLLTIDDAPDKHALEMAQKLKDLNVPAIFFVNGHFMDTDEERKIVKQIHELGFEIGNHTMTHANLSKLSVDKQRYEITQLSEEIQNVTGEAPKFFRAPFGVNTDFSKQLMEEQQMIYMNWTYGYDWEKEYQTSASIADIMVNTPLLTDGAILLMHDRDWTNEALMDIVKGLEAKGYTFVDPDQIVQ
ncbi:polysaccharide deacetylase family protein [Pseudalkalibacillus sp. Hm43]|uniref:polysaccharide deacetylase family protein n=1 Tax=Pseudalkalibacillus sp. Hm43 TaxID=3450742 RepID=UPI003F428C1E